MRRSEPPLCWWENMGTGRCGSRTRAGHSAFMRSRRGRIIRGASACGLSAEHSDGGETLNRTFLLWE